MLVVQNIQLLFKIDFVSQCDYFLHVSHIFFSQLAFISLFDLFFVQSVQLELVFSLFLKTHHQLIHLLQELLIKFIRCAVFSQYCIFIGQDLHLSFHSRMHRL
jgi:hypothetical protein